MARKIRCNDEVVVLSGKDKGKRGRVRCIFSSRNKAIVSGINIVKKHRKPMPSTNSSGGIFEQESAMDISNLAIFNSSLCKADRIGFKIDETGKKVRIFKSTGKALEN